MDWKDLGLRSGIEIHQQLDTTKLFCDCKSEIPIIESSGKVKRYLRASAGEQGEVDVASLYEMEKGKYFEYITYPNLSCLVELDEEPIHEINQEALKIVLQVAKVLKAKIVDEIQIMRKTVVDGSNTSGFQRTALVARNGSLDVDGKKIGIQTVCLEEDSCMISERKEGEDIYNLSRLGIPLVEIATDPDMTDPAEVQ